MDGYEYNVNTLNEGDIPELGFMNNCHPSVGVECFTRNSEGSALMPIECMNENFSLNFFENPVCDYLCDNDFSRSIYSDLSYQPTGYSIENNTNIIQDNSYLGYPLFTSDVNGTQYSNQCLFDSVGNYNPRSLFTTDDLGISNCNYGSNQHTSLSNELFLNTVDQQNHCLTNIEKSDTKIKCEINCEDTVNVLQTLNSLQPNVNGEEVTGNTQIHLLESFEEAFPKSGNVLRSTTPFNGADLTNNFGNKDSTIDQNHDEKPLIDNIENNDCNMEEYYQDHNPDLLSNKNVSELSANEVPLTKNVPSTSNEAHNKSQSVNDTSYLHVLDLYKSNMQGASLYQQNHSVQNPSFIVLHPLQTRKFAPSHLFRQNNTYSENIKLNSSDSLSSNGSKIVHQNNYTQNADSIDLNISIPMPGNLSVSTCPCDVLSQNKVQKPNRRKQNLNSIPDAEHISFEIKREIESNEENESCAPATNIVGNLQLKVEVEDPYPEVELPELDEIFRRKKRTYTSSNSGNKRTLPRSELNKTTSTKKLASPKSVDRQLNIMQETSTSFEEKISISRNISANICNDDTVRNSDSDLGEHDCEVIYAKSLKCSNCNKIFKTARSLAIHTKHCNTLTNIAKEHNITKLTYDLIENSKLKLKGRNDAVAHLISNGTNINDNKRKNNNICLSKKLQSDCDGPLRKKTKTNLKEIGRETFNSRNYLRPITRSQTRRSMDPVKPCSSSKRSKKLK